MLGPNITGDTSLGQQSTSKYFATGCFSLVGENNNIGLESYDTNNQKLSFKASTSNSLYKDSSTVQPAAITALILIKFV